MTKKKTTLRSLRNQDRKEVTLQAEKSNKLLEKYPYRKLPDRSAMMNIG